MRKKMTRDDWDRLNERLARKKLFDKIMLNCGNDFDKRLDLELELLREDMRDKLITARKDINRTFDSLLEDEEENDEED